MGRLSQAGQVSGRSISTRTKASVGIVVDVIVDDQHEDITETGIDNGTFESRSTFMVGSVKVRKVDDVNSDVSDLRYYKPIDITTLDLPIIGETVDLVQLGNGNIVYRRITDSKVNSGNFLEDADAKVNPKTEEPIEGGASEKKTTAATGTPNSSSPTDDSIKNKYFEPTQINPLMFFEGDKVIQSRFGQSIRFSGYNNIDNVLAPTIVIRNRQGNKSLEELKDGSPTMENIIDDGSIIVLSSGEHLLEFTPGQIDTPMETTPIYAEEPELKGTDQVLINSGRIILSSKDSEMLFYSKGNYGFISDGKFTIDNGLDGAEMDFNGDVLITTNDNNFTINPNGGSGEIYLNTDSVDEPLVRGETLKDLLEQLIDAINAQIFSTPAGPTMVGPNNRGDFNKIKSKLDTFLSTLNYTE
jgi:hypothetical protein